MDNISGSSDFLPDIELDEESELFSFNVTLLYKNVPLNEAIQDWTKMFILVDTTNHPKRS